MLLVAMPGAPSSDALAPSSFLLLVVRPGAPSSVLAPSSSCSAEQYVSFYISFLNMPFSVLTLTDYPNPFGIDFLGFCCYIH